MDFRHSEKIDPNTYSTDDDLCRGIDLRMHKDPVGEIRGVTRCQNDWSKLVSPARNYRGALGDPFSFIRVTIPECLPERLEIISYADEYAFLYDDAFVEDLNQILGPEHRSCILDDFSRQTSSRPGLDGVSEDAALKATGAKQIQSQIIREMMAIDEAKALTTLKSWQKSMEHTASRQRSESLTGLDEYIPYRMTDSAELFWFGLVTFAMDLAIPDHEMDLCKKLGYPAWAAVVLTNDLYSWEKERDDAAKMGDSYVVNAIWVIMREHTVAESQARELCRQKIKEFATEARRVTEQTKGNADLSRDLRAFIEALLYTISGNLVWSTYCPRYHPENFNEDLARSMWTEIDGA